MASLQHILVFVTVMSTNPWSHGVASEIPQNDSQNQQWNESHDKNYLQEVQKLIFRPGNESSRMSERSIMTDSTAQGFQNQPRSGGSYKIQNVYSKNYPKANRRGQLQEASSLDKIVFPGPSAERTRTSKIKPEVSEECRKMGFCLSVPNYPNEEATKIVIDVGVDRERKFHIDKLDIPDTPEIAQRLGPMDDNLELCSFREEVVYPQTLPDKKNEWHFVVNPKEKPVQGVRVELCDVNKLQCASFVSFQPGYTARCVQKYAERHMQVLKEGVMTEMPLKVPTCCSCVAKYVES